jgi:hypothetical protein
MHTIDLLNGQGIPAKATPRSVALVMVVVAVPLLVAGGMLDRFLQNREAMAIQQLEIDKNEETIEELADAIEWKESIDNRDGIIHARLSEVSSCVDQYVQWSPVLVTLVENMPKGMVMGKLLAEGPVPVDKSRTRQANSSNLPATAYTRKLVLDISGKRSGNYGEKVQEFRNSLQSLLGPRLENIEVWPRGGSESDETDFWTMNITFKCES